MCPKLCLILQTFCFLQTKSTYDLVGLIWDVLGRIICFCVCLSWNFKPSKAWNFNPSKAWKQLFVIVFRRVEISSFRRVEIKRQNRWLKLISKQFDLVWPVENKVFSSLNFEVENLTWENLWRRSLALVCGIDRFMVSRPRPLARIDIFQLQMLAFKFQDDVLRISVSACN